MFAFTDVMHLFANEFASLRAGRFSFLLVFSGSFHSFFFGHGAFSFRTDRTDQKWMQWHLEGMAGNGPSGLRNPNRGAFQHARSSQTRQGPGTPLQRLVIGTLITSSLALGGVQLVEAIKR